MGRLVQGGVVQGRVVHGVVVHGGGHDQREVGAISPIPRRCPSSSQIHQMPCREVRRVARQLQVSVLIFQGVARERRCARPNDVSSGSVLHRLVWANHGGQIGRARAAGRPSGCIGSGRRHHSARLYKTVRGGS